MDDPRHRKPAVEIAAFISEMGLLKSVVAALMIKYEDLSVRDALLHSFVDAMINKRGLCKDLLIGKRAAQSVCRKRHELMWELKRLGFTAIEVGKYFNRTGYAVTYACRKQELLNKKRELISNEKDKESEEFGHAAGRNHREGSTPAES